MGAESSSLDLTEQQLTEIPEDAIQKIERLHELNLSGNRIKQLPGGLDRLHSLNLSENEMTEISPEIIATLATYFSLRELNLSKNKIAEFQDPLKPLTALKVLDLSHNELSGVQVSLHLDELNLSKNLIPEFPSHLPDSLKKLNMDFNRMLNVEISFERLESLSIVMNGLACFSSSTRLPNLKVLNLNMNDLPGLPDMRIVTPKLEHLSADGNSLEEVPHLPETLIKLSLARNSIERLIDFKTETPSLAYLDLASNCVPDIGKLPHTIRSLNLSSNRLSVIPNMDLPSLKKVNLAHNNLTQVPKLTSSRLKGVVLSGNQLETLDGFIFPKSLVTFIASKNRIKEIPLSLATLPGLKTLELCWNEITRVPPEISKSTIATLNLSMNPIESLPDLPRSIQTLMVVGCHLKQLPETLASTHLVELCASNNELTSIPYIESLEICRVSRNHLECFPRVPKTIHIVDVSHNQISKGHSHFPNQEIIDLDISHNHFASMPKHLLKAQSLLWFDMSYNPFGKLKASFKDLDNLKKIACIGNNMVVYGGRNTSIIILDVLEDQPYDPEEHLSINRVACSDIVGVSEMTGKRPTMEDTVCVKYHDGISTFAVFDGHKGNASSIWASRIYADLFYECGSVTKQFLYNAVETISEKLKEKELVDGSTAIICTVSKTKLYMCNVGDSRAIVLDDQGGVTFSTKDHKPSDKTEINRVMSIGGTITDMRIDGKLAVSRSISDFYVDGIMRDPDVFQRVISPHDKWLILCCDGVWDVLASEEIGKMSLSAKDAKTFACDIRNVAYGLGSRDNITVIAVDLRELVARMPEEE